MNIQQSVKSYLENKDTQFALLINGSWGSGKTHFWNSTLRNEVVNRSRIPNGFGNNPFYTDLYISLYSIKSTEEISAKILLRLFSLDTNNPIFKLFRKLGTAAAGAFLNVQNINYSVEEVSTFAKLKNYVIVFDDLERISSAELLHAVLGYINYLSEHAGIKTIILTDEKRLSEIFSNSWTLVREKIVYQVLSLSPQYTDAVRKTLDKFADGDPQFYKYIIDHYTLINSVFEKSETNNLRSLYFGLEQFRILFGERIVEFNGLDSTKSCLYWMIAISFEYRAGRATSSFKLDALEKLINQSRFYRANEQLQSDLIGFMDERNFAERYGTNAYDFALTQEILDSIFMGHVVPEINHMFLNSLEEISQKNNLIRYYDNVIDFGYLEMPHKELEVHVNKIIDGISKDGYPVTYFPGIFSIISELVRLKLITKDLDRFLKILVEKIENYFSQGNRHHIVNLVAFFEFQAPQLRDEAKFLSDKIIEKNEQLYRRALRHLAKKISTELGNTIEYASLFNVPDPVYEGRTFNAVTIFDCDDFFDILKYGTNRFLNLLLRDVQNNISCDGDKQYFAQLKKKIFEKENGLETLNLDTDRTRALLLDEIFKKIQ